MEWLVYAQARLALRLEHREALAHEPHALSGTQPHVLGLRPLVGPAMARFDRDAAAALALQPQQLARRQRRAEGRRLDSQRGGHSARLSRTVWWRAAKSRVSVEKAARTEA